MTSILKVDTIQNTGGTTGLTIDSSGRVTRPVIPAWRLCLSALQNITTAGGSGTDVAFDDSSAGNFGFLQGGCTLSSGVITVPVTGLYQVNATLRFDDIGSGYIIMRILKNNGQSNKQELYVINGSPSTSYETLSGGDVLSCTANDTIRISAMASADTSWHLDPNGCKFSGYLIG